MKIDTITLYKVRLPLISPWTTAYGSDNEIITILIKIQSGSYCGWGEASPLGLPCYSPEYSNGVYMVARDIFGPLLKGREINSGEELQSLLAPFKGNQFAKAAFDLAWWDLEAKMRQIPLWQLLGGVHRPICVGADFGFQDSIDILLEKIETAVFLKYPRIKLKYGPSWGVEVIRAVRKEFPDQTFHIDCNSSFSMDDLEMFVELDQYRLAMFEQPLRYDDVLDHAALQAQVSTPICLDESLNSVFRARQAIQLHSAKIFNLKPGRLGGITPLLAVKKLADQAGISCWIGGMLESGIGLAHLIALASLEHITYPSDLFPSDHFFREDILTRNIAFAELPFFTLPEQPGIGVVPDEDKIACKTLESAIIK